MKGIDTLKSLILITITSIRAKTTINPPEIAIPPGSIEETGVIITVIVSKRVFAKTTTNA
jgi:hypothetical protein